MSDKFKMIPDFKVDILVKILAEVTDYNHMLSNIPEMWKTTTGKNVKVVVLDTGLPHHNDLSPVGSSSFVEDYLEDKNGHSTHVGGIIAAIAGNGMGVAGVAPDVDDFYGAVLDETGSGTIETIISGIRWAVDEVGAHIINMSLGIPASVPLIKDLEKACEYAVNNGTTIIAAAGNEASKLGQPACYDCVIAVGAVDKNKKHANFSNVGKELDFVTGGVNVFSTFLNNSYAKLSGTSMAAPVLSGIAALILSKHLQDGVKLTPNELYEHLLRIAYDVGPKGFDEIYGNGIPVFKSINIPDTSNQKNELADKETTSCIPWKLWKAFIAAANDTYITTKDLTAAIGSGLNSINEKTKIIDNLLK